MISFHTWNTLTLLVSGLTNRTRLALLKLPSVLFQLLPLQRCLLSWSLIALIAWELPFSSFTFCVGMVPVYVLFCPFTPLLCTFFYGWGWRSGWCFSFVFIGSLPFSSHFHYSQLPFAVTSCPFLYRVYFFSRRKAFFTKALTFGSIHTQVFLYIYTLCFQTTKSQFMFCILVFNWTFSFWGCLCFLLFFFCSLSPVYPYILFSGLCC